MGLCYHCGRDVEHPKRCRHCNLTFCEEHLPPEAHRCLGFQTVIPTQNTPPDRSLRSVVYRYMTPSRTEKQSRSSLTERMNDPKIVFTMLTLAVCVASLLVLTQLHIPESPGQFFPVTGEAAELQLYTLQLINAEREKNGLPGLNLDLNRDAQRYAEEMLATGKFRRNPDLPAGVAENIACCPFNGDVNLTRGLRSLIDGFMEADEPPGLEYRRTLLSREYSTVCIGVAFDAENLILVQDFS